MSEQEMAVLRMELAEARRLIERQKEYAEEKGLLATRLQTQLENYKDAQEGQIVIKELGRDDIRIGVGAIPGEPFNRVLIIVTTENLEATPKGMPPEGSIQLQFLNTFPVDVMISKLEEIKKNMMAYERIGNHGKKSTPETVN